MAGALIDYAVVHRGPRQFEVIHRPSGRVCYSHWQRQKAEDHLAWIIQRHANAETLTHEEAVQKLIALHTNTEGW
jgi:hypothetical protein